MNPIRVLHIATDDAIGGAGRAAYRLHTGLRHIGHESRMLVSRRRSADPYVRRFDAPVSWSSRLRRRLGPWRTRRALTSYRDTRPWSPEEFSDARAWPTVEQAPEIRECDVINLHYVAGFLDLERFFKNIPELVPVIWTLHDMNLITGGCHYDLACGRYQKECGTCPQLGSHRENDLSRRVWRRKQAFFNRLQADRLHLVAPSRWLANIAKNSPLLAGKFGVTVIPNGLDVDSFAPRDKDFSRRVLGIPRESLVVLFVAENVKNRRKGFDLLLEALPHLQDLPDLHLVSVGKGGAELDAAVPHLPLSYTGEERLLSLVYSAADVFVLPSRQDNLPSTVLEALSCGVPVVGFRVGGVPELIRPGVTGTLARPEDPGSLATAIREILSDSEARSGMAAECRRTAVLDYTVDTQVQRYAELYRERLHPATKAGAGEEAPVGGPGRGRAMVGAA